MKYILLKTENIKSIILVTSGVKIIIVFMHETVNCFLLLL